MVIGKGNGEGNGEVRGGVCAGGGDGETRAEEDTGPWSREAADLFAWRPPSVASASASATASGSASASASASASVSVLAEMA